MNKSFEYQEQEKIKQTINKEKNDLNRKSLRERINQTQDTSKEKRAINLADLSNIQDEGT